MKAPIVLRAVIAVFAALAVVLFVLGQPRWAGACIAVVVLGLFLTPWHLTRRWHERRSGK